MLVGRGARRRKEEKDKEVTQGQSMEGSFGGADQILESGASAKAWNHGRQILEGR
jgi:hypothetical protein